MNCINHIIITPRQLFILNNFSRINGQFTNKVDTLIENPGFEATLQSVQFEDKLKLIIKDIDNLKYIEHLDIYIDNFSLLKYLYLIIIPIYMLFSYLLCKLLMNIRIAISFNFIKLINNFPKV